MRSYIFSDIERKIVEDFLNGNIPITHRRLSQIRTRLKNFKALAGDVDLYLRLRKAVSATSA